MVTLKDIAEIAGVHVSTVSKALRGSTDINKETRQRITEIAKEKGYKIKNIIKKDTNGFGIIGVICPEIISNYYAQIIRIIEEEVKKEGYFCMIGFTNFDKDTEKYYLNHLTNANIEGVIFLSESKDLEKVLFDYSKNIDIPLVLIAQNTETKDFDCIRIDDEYGVRLAIEHLLELGHTQIGYLGDELSDSRLEIFTRVMEENKLKINKRWIQVSKERFEKCGFDLMNNILKSEDVPTAIFAAYDDIAIGAIKAIKDKGLDVPKDISVIGIDDVRVATYFHPELTTIAGPMVEMGKIAVKLLFKKIVDDQYNVIQNVRLSPRLVQRKSTRAIGR
jgi:DNA-binding LacI/PurR family transcriptional regulator